MTESEVARLAREEAERAEAESPDDPGTTDETPETQEGEGEDDDAEEAGEPVEPQEAPQEALTEAQLEARAKAWERERDRHFRELRKRDADRYDANEVCPLCDGHGMFWPQIPEPEQTFRRQTISVLLGGDQPLAYPDDEDTETCAKCQGTGMTRTGSKVPNQETRPCPMCNAQGWKLKTPTAPVTPLFTTPMTAANGQTVPLPQVGPLDMWQRPFGHPDYGRNPAEVNA